MYKKMKKMKNANIFTIFNDILCNFNIYCNFIMRHYVLDGHNILFKDTEFKTTFSTDPAHALNMLIVRCQRIISGKKKKCSIFFDGAPPGNIASSIQNVQVTFSYNRSADALIKSLIARSKNPRNLIVVSDDAEIQRYARAHSCEVLPVRRFLKETLQSGESNDPEKPTTDDLSIEEWLRLFKK